MIHHETQDAYSTDTSCNYFLNTGVYQYIWVYSLHAHFGICRSIFVLQEKN